jgi:hypothetical protein
MCKCNDPCKSYERGFNPSFNQGCNPCRNYQYQYPILLLQYQLYNNQLRDSLNNQINFIQAYPLIGYNLFLF